MEEPVVIDRAANGVLTVTLNRPQRRNAFDEQMVEELSSCFRGCRDDASVRVVVVAATGPCFCAGADLNWMQRMADFTPAENLADARKMAAMFRSLSSLPQPVIAAVQGTAMGGGVGLVAACDFAIAARSASFALPEVRLGLVPAVIAPYLEEALGRRNARRLSLSGENFSAAVAREMGLVHELVSEGELRRGVDILCRQLRKNGPAAMAAVKRRLFAGGGEQRADRSNAELIAELRRSPEGREGIRAFLGKSIPDWVGDYV